MKTEEKTVKGKDLLGNHFEVRDKFQIAETVKEAIDGNDKAKGLGKKAADSLVIAKFLTNQMDTVRNKEAEKRNKAIMENAKNAIADPKKKKALEDAGLLDLITAIAK